MISKVVSVLPSSTKSTSIVPIFSSTNLSISSRVAGSLSASLYAGTTIDRLVIVLLAANRPPPSDYFSCLSAFRFYGEQIRFSLELGPYLTMNISMPRLTVEEEVALIHGRYILCF